MGLGFTTQRLARRLLLRGWPVSAITRNPDRFRSLAALGLQIADFGSEAARTGAIVVHTIPPQPDAAVREAVIRLKPKRILYISSTGVYGKYLSVDENTPADPESGPRIEEEDWISAGPWKSLVVRPAAIYGPGRGVHMRIAAGLPVRGMGPEPVSRIHADDLAGILEAAIGSDIEGKWPVADEHPCSSDEMNSFCSLLLRKPVIGTDHPSIRGRSVDGRGILRELELTLAYPNFQAGILASVAFEKLA